MSPPGPLLAPNCHGSVNIQLPCPKGKFHDAVHVLQLPEESDSGWDLAGTGLCPKLSPCCLPPLPMPVPLPHLPPINQHSLNQSSSASWSLSAPQLARLAKGHWKSTIFIVRIKLSNPYKTQPFTSISAIELSHRS